MSHLHETLSPQVDLSTHGIERSENDLTVGDMVEKILERRRSHPGDPKGKTWADRQSYSVNLPLRILLRQQLTVSGEERTSTERITEATRNLVGDIALIGFHQEDDVVAALEKALYGDQMNWQEERRELLAA